MAVELVSGVGQGVGALATATPGLTEALLVLWIAGAAATAALFAIRQARDSGKCCATGRKRSLST